MDDLVNRSGKQEKKKLSLIDYNEAPITSSRELLLEVEVVTLGSMQKCFHVFNDQKPNGASYWNSPFTFVHLDDNQ